MASRLESLKKSGIKIKIKQNQNPGSLTNLTNMRESGDYTNYQGSETSSLNVLNEPAQKQPVPAPLRRRENNPMFWSTVSGMERRYSTPEFMSNLDASTGKSYFEREDEKFVRREDMRREIAKLLFQDNANGKGETADDSSAPLRKEKEKRENPMFWSTAQTYKKKETKKDEPNIFEEFILPRGVGKSLEDEDENIRTMEHHITKEKYKVNIDMDQILQEVAEILTEQKNLIHSNLDIYLEQYKQNYRMLREKVTQYKDKAKEFFNSQDSRKNFIAQQQQQQAFNPVMKKVQFYRVDPTTPNNTFNKFKEESCNVQANAASINREVSKRLIGFLTDELTKQTMHKPLYNHTESLQMMFTEVKENIIAKTKECLEDFAPSMAYITTPEIFSNIFAFPQIESCISEDNLNIIGDSEKLLNTKINLESAIKFEENVKSLCVRAIPVDYAAIGCSDGIVRVWNYSTSALVSFFKAHNSAVTTINMMNIQTGDLNENVILTGGSSPDPTIRAWQVANQKCVRLLKGHKDDVLALLPLRDGLTLLSASKENHILVWNMQTGKLFNKLANHSAQINGLHLIKDNSRFVSISKDKTFCVWKIIYEYSNQLKRRVVFSCELDKVFEDVCEITSVNSATDNCNIIITGGLDNKIKLWDIEKNACIKSIDGHSNGIGEMIYFENPFKIEAYEQYMIISLGFNESSLMVSRSTNSTTTPLIGDYRVGIDRDITTNQKMQLIRATRDNNLKIIMISHGELSNLLVWNFSSDLE